MINQIGHRLRIVKKQTLLVAGLSVIWIHISIGIMNAPPSKAHSSDVDLKKYVDEDRSDSFQGAK